MGSILEKIIEWILKLFRREEEMPEEKKPGEETKGEKKIVQILERGKAG